MMSLLRHRSAVTAPLVEYVSTGATTLDVNVDVGTHRTFDVKTVGRVRFSPLIAVKSLYKLLQSTSLINHENILSASLRLNRSITNISFAFKDQANLETAVINGDYSNVNSSLLLFYRNRKLSEIQTLVLLKSTSIRNMFAENYLVQMIDLTVSQSCKDAAYFAYECRCITDLVCRGDWSGITTFSSELRDFYGCRSLVNFTGLPNVKKTWRLEGASISDESINNCINNLGDCTDRDTQTFTMPLAKFNTLTNAQIAVATAKNWTLQGL